MPDCEWYDGVELYSLIGEMSIHDKMQADYLWVRHAPVEEGVKVRHHGQFFQYDRAANAAERLEMTYRSMGKQYDWELEKFRLSRKANDKGNKKRFIKNLFRFIKHPVAYINWKTMSWWNPAPKLLTLAGLLFIVGQINYWKNISNEYAEIDTVLTHYGKNVEGTSGRMKGYHNRKQFHRINTIEGVLYTHFWPSMVTLNPTWRQNLRKELQLTNNYNVVF